MSISLCDVGRMKPMRSVYGIESRHGIQRPDTNEFANRIIQKCDKNGDGALNADELGKMLSYGVGKMMSMRGMFGMRSVYGMGCRHGMGCIRSMQKPDANEIANQIIKKRDKDSDGALSADELGKFSERLGLVEADFDEDGLIDREKLVTKISEKLEEISKKSVHLVTETQSSSDTEPSDVVTETQSKSDLVKQLLSQLDLSEEEIKSFFENMQNCGIDVTV